MSAALDLFYVALYSIPVETMQCDVFTVNLP